VADLYSLLGVSKRASQGEIKKAYRKLAGKFHPDRNPGAANERRFKQVTGAYEVLGDNEKRQLYDEFGDASLQSGFDAEKARAMRDFGFGGFVGGDRGGRTAVDLNDLFGGGGAAPGGFGDMLGDLFRRTRTQPSAAGRTSGRVEQQQRGHDTKSTVTIDFKDAVLGTTLRLTPSSSQGDPITVRIPPGANDGSRVRVKGKGGAGAGGVPAGDLLLSIKVRPHKHFTRDGVDLYVDLPITVAEAFHGAHVRVPTPFGEVKLKVPQGAQSGQQMRLRGKGVKKKKKADGDLYVRFLVRYPNADNSAVGDAIDVLAEHMEDPRGELDF